VFKFQFDPASLHEEEACVSKIWESEKRKRKEEKERIEHL